MNTRLPEPIQVQMLRANGAPFAGKVVSFEVTRSDGRLTSAPSTGPGSMRFQAITDEEGIARAYWTPGFRRRLWKQPRRSDQPRHRGHHRAVRDDHARSGVADQCWSGQQPAGCLERAAPRAASGLRPRWAEPRRRRPGDIRGGQGRRGVERPGRDRSGDRPDGPRPGRFHAGPGSREQRRVGHLPRQHDAAGDIHRRRRRDRSSAANDLRRARLRQLEPPDRRRCRHARADDRGRGVLDRHVRDRFVLARRRPRGPRPVVRQRLGG